MGACHAHELRNLCVMPPPTRGLRTAPHPPAACAPHLTRCLHTLPLPADAAGGTAAAVDTGSEDYAEQLLQQADGIEQNVRGRVGLCTAGCVVGSSGSSVAAQHSLLCVLCVLRVLPTGVFAAAQHSLYVCRNGVADGHMPHGERRCGG